MPTATLVARAPSGTGTGGVNMGRLGPMNAP
jgi:hypothetical protein